MFNNIIVDLSNICY